MLKEPKNDSQEIYPDTGLLGHGESHLLKSRIRDLETELSRTKETLQSEIHRRRLIEKRYDLEIRKTWQYIYVANAFFMTVKANEILSYVNKRVLDTMGYTLKQMVGKNFFEQFVHQEDRKKAREIFHQMMTEAEMAKEHFECRVLTKTGDIRLIVLHYTPLKNKAGTTSASIAFGEDVTRHRQIEAQLKEKTRYLEEGNQALKHMLEHREVEKRAVEEAIVMHLKRLVAPHLDQLKCCNLNQKARTYLKIVQTGINDMAYYLSKTISSKYVDLTPSEIQIAELIRQGKTSKDIAEFMNISPSTVSFHRNNLRKKLGILKEKTNLRSYLSSFSN